MTRPGRFNSPNAGAIGSNCHGPKLLGCFGGQEKRLASTAGVTFAQVSLVTAETDVLRLRDAAQPTHRPRTAECSMFGLDRLEAD